MSELLPCPFCGNATNFLARGIDGMPYCGECGAQPGRLDWNTRSDLAQAMVAAAYEVAAYECAGSNLGLTAEDVADDIRDHTPADARAALGAMLAKAREDALREAANRLLSYHFIAPANLVAQRQVILALIDRTAEGEA